MRLVGEHILICISHLPDKNPSPALQTLLGFVAPALCVFHGKATFVPHRQTPKLLLCGEPGKSKSHLLTPPIVWPCRLLSAACHNQRATRVPRACLGFGRALPCTCLLMHELGMFESKELTERQGKRGGREGRREGSHRQALFIRLLGGAKAQRCWGGRGGVGRAHQCVIRLGTLTDVDS